MSGQPRPAWRWVLTFAVAGAALGPCVGPCVATTVRGSMYDGFYLYALYAALLGLAVGGACGFLGWLAARLTGSSS